jgi:hypothetical protein
MTMLAAGLVSSGGTSQEPEPDILEFTAGIDGPEEGYYGLVRVEIPEFNSPFGTVESGIFGLLQAVTYYSVAERLIVYAGDGGTPPDEDLFDTITLTINGGAPQSFTVGDLNYDDTGTVPSGYRFWAWGNGPVIAEGDSVVVEVD